MVERPLGPSLTDKLDVLNFTSADCLRVGSHISSAPSLFRWAATVTKNHPFYPDAIRRINAAGQSSLRCYHRTQFFLKISSRSTCTRTGKWISNESLRNQHLHFSFPTEGKQWVPMNQYLWGQNSLVLVITQTPIYHKALLLTHGCNKREKQSYYESTKQFFEYFTAEHKGLLQKMYKLYVHGVLMSDTAQIAELFSRGKLLKKNQHGV